MTVELPAGSCYESGEPPALESVEPPIGVSGIRPGTDGYGSSFVAWLPEVLMAEALAKIRTVAA